MKLELFLVVASVIVSKTSPSCLDALSTSDRSSISFVPKCDDDGSYAAMQCHDSTGLCWCATLNGTKINEPSQDKYKACECVRKAHSVKGKKLIGSYVPQCQVNGFYKKKQCQGSTGSCWCASEETGLKLTQLTAEEC